MAEPPTDHNPTAAPDPEALMRSDNPWDWLLASFLGLDGEAEAGPGQPAPTKQAIATLGPPNCAVGWERQTVARVVPVCT